MVSNLVANFKIAIFRFKARTSLVKTQFIKSLRKNTSHKLKIHNIHIAITQLIQVSVAPVLSPLICELKIRIQTYQTYSSLHIFQLFAGLKVNSHFSSSQTITVYMYNEKSENKFLVNDL